MDQACRSVCTALRKRTYARTVYSLLRRLQQQIDDRRPGTFGRDRHSVPRVVAICQAATYGFCWKHSIRLALQNSVYLGLLAQGSSQRKLFAHITVSRIEVVLPKSDSDQMLGGFPFRDVNLYTYLALWSQLCNAGLAVQTGCHHVKAYIVHKLNPNVWGRMPPKWKQFPASNVLRQRCVWL